MIPHLKNAEIGKGACRVCVDWWTDLSKTNCQFPKHKDYPTVKYKRGGNGSEVNIKISKAPDERPVNEENLLSPCRTTFKFLNKHLRYA